MISTENSIYEKYTPSQIKRLKLHLEQRFSNRKDKQICGVVFDILHRCDLNCRGCGTNAKYVTSEKVTDAQPTFEQIKIILDKIKLYSEENNKKIFVNIGGGEPFLRHDIIDILEYAASLFQSSGVGVDTNGSLPNSLNLIKQAAPYLSYIGISINGLEDYHNWWAANNHINAFRRSTSVIQELCKDQGISDKLEITSVATKKNIKDIPKLISQLANIGVKNYSVHRAIPVGRMANIMDLIPSAEEYLDLLIALIEAGDKYNVNVHLHHSIESIHATLLLGLNTYAPDKVGNPDMSSSIGVEPNGAVVFDPWCTTGIWKSITGGNLFNPNVNLYDILEVPNGSVLDLAKLYTAPHLRCNGCIKQCSGGSRIAAAANKLKTLNESEITDNDIFDAMTAIDPACPLYH